jgi:hypothetical protein
MPTSKNKKQRKPTNNKKQKKPGTSSTSENI